MSETVDRLFESLKAVKESVQAVAPGLKNLGPDVTAEMSRLGTQGAMELASALCNGNGFVPYGPGQYTPTAEPAAKDEPQREQQHQHQQERGGIER